MDEKVVGWKGMKQYTCPAMEENEAAVERLLNTMYGGGVALSW